MPDLLFVASGHHEIEWNVLSQELLQPGGQTFRYKGQWYLVVVHQAVIDESVDFQWST